MGLGDVDSTGVAVGNLLSVWALAGKAAPCGDIRRLVVERARRRAVRRDAKGEVL
jgi:hypothetical protein